MSKPSYDSTKVQQFLNSLKKYKTDKTIYMNTLTTFNEELNTLTKSHTGADVISSDFNPQYIDNITDITYNSFITNEGVVVYKNGSSASADGFQENALNSSKQYVSDLHVNDDSYTGKVSNVVVQMGLDDLAFQNDSAENKVYQIPKDTLPVIDNSTAGTTLTPQTCDINFLYACNSKAKLTDMPYYGIADKDGNNGTSCQCYTFTESDKPTTEIDPTIKTGIVTTINGKNVDNISYLGTLFDGKLYALKDVVYSNNFTDLYNTTNTNIIEIDTTYHVANCNSFTGSGVNDISFFSLGDEECRADLK